MVMAMAMAGKKMTMHFDVNLATRAVVVVLGGLCMPHGRVICPYGHYTTPNRQYVLLSARLISQVTWCSVMAMAAHMQVYAWLRHIKLGSYLYSPKMHVRS